MFGMNPAQMRRMMSNLKTDKIDAERVIIETADKKIIIEEPQVTAIELQGQKTYTVIGEERIETAGSGESEAKENEINEEDVELVQQKTGKSREEAEKALRETGNDIALAIKKLS